MIQSSKPLRLCCTAALLSSRSLQLVYTLYTAFAALSQSVLTRSCNIISSWNLLSQFTSLLFIFHVNFYCLPNHSHHILPYSQHNISNLFSITCSCYIQLCVSSLQPSSHVHMRVKTVSLYDLPSRKDPDKQKVLITTFQLELEIILFGNIFILTLYFFYLKFYYYCQYYIFTLPSSSSIIVSKQYSQLVGPIYCKSEISDRERKKLGITVFPGESSVEPHVLW